MRRGICSVSQSVPLSLSLSPLSSGFAKADAISAIVVKKQGERFSHWLRTRVCVRCVLLKSMYFAPIWSSFCVFVFFGCVNFGGLGRLIVWAPCNYWRNCRVCFARIEILVWLFVSSDLELHSLPSCFFSILFILFLAVDWMIWSFICSFVVWVLSYFCGIVVWLIPVIWEIV